MSEQARITGRVVEFIVGARFEDMPPEAIALGKRCVIDGLGVVLAGSTTQGSLILRNYIKAGDRASEATAFAPEPFRATAAVAALANAASGHAMDWDDTQLSTTADRIFGLM